MWTDGQWGVFAALLDEAWPGDFDDAQRSSWRMLLDGVEPSTAVEALKRLLYEGRKWRPSVSEFLAEASADPSTPTFEEAWRIILVCLKARAGGMMGQTIQNGEAARTAAILRALDAHHPSIRAFVERQGVDRLRMLRVDDPEHGELRLKELRAAWDRFRESSKDREIAAIAAGAPISHLRRLDPLRDIGVPALALAPGDNPKGAQQQ